jgi:cytochrome c oxidase subunit 2
MPGRYLSFSTFPRKSLNNADINADDMRKLILLAIAGLLVLTACTRETTSPVAQPTPATPQEDTPASPGGDVKEFVLKGSQWVWEPSTITVKKGDHVRLKVTATDVAHGIAIKEFGVSEHLPPGEEKVIEFTADKTGEFEFVCSVYCGKDHKLMRGKLIVE